MIQLVFTGNDYFLINWRVKKYINKLIKLVDRVFYIYLA